MTATKNIVLTYTTDASSETETESHTVIDPETGQTTETTTITTTTTDDEGNVTVSTTTYETITNDDGSTSQTESQQTTNPDGSSSSSSTITNYDENGDLTGTTVNETEVDADGSFESTTTNYDENGDPTSGQNQTGDSNGNVNTQGVIYDENGDSTVTSYSIDTSGNPDGGKEYNGDGVNTEYYAFDVTRGFIVDMKFTVDCSNKPSGQDENHHNILTAKRASPSPWYGFQLRQSSTSQYINLGTQFSTGSNTNTRINPISLQGNIASYDLQIIYDPTLTTGSFKCIDKSTGNVVYTSNGKFPDIDDLKYIKVTVGYAMDENGDPFRYSKIDVENFSIRRLTKAAMPAIECDGQLVTITCETSGADIYYRLNHTGSFIEYTAPFAIATDTVVEAYAEYDSDQSDTVTKTCIYDSGVADPVVNCDGENISITCSTLDATIYYRLNRTGEFVVYTEPIAILTDTIVETYAKVNNRTSNLVTETCIYNPEHDYSSDYLTFRITNDGDIAWQAYGTGYTRTIEYSINNGTWQSITSAADPNVPTIAVETGDVIRFRGTNTTYAGSNVNYSGFGGSTAEFDIEGNIMSLINGDNFINTNTLSGSYNFCSLFKLTEVVSAENLILPATTLTPHCYRALFANSPSLEIAPELPATTLAVSCYRYMFQDCGITTAPDLLATTLVTSCYEGMFNNCLNLTYIKCLATNVEAMQEATAS